MADIQVQLRRGTTSAHTTFAGAEGEVTVDTDLDTLMVHTGGGAGTGVRLAKHSELGGIADGAVTTAKLADDAVTTAKLADGAVTSVKTNFNTLEVGHPTAAFIDLKTPGTDDYDARVISEGDSVTLDPNHLSRVRVESSSQLGFVAGAVPSTSTPGPEVMTIKQTEVVVNDRGIDIDFRVEGNTGAALITTDAGDNKVGIRGPIDSTFPVYIHGDQAAGMGVTGNIQINTNNNAGIRISTLNNTSPLQQADIFHDNQGTITFTRPQKPTNATTHLFAEDGDTTSLSGVYGTISDRNLKENINYLTEDQKNGQVEDIKNLRFAKFNLIGEDRKQLGVIAQDVEETSPGLVSKAIRDGVEVRSIKQSIIHQKAVVALQVALQKIEALEARIKVLESK